MLPGGVGAWPPKSCGARTVGAFQMKRKPPVSDSQVTFCRFFGSGGFGMRKLATAAAEMSNAQVP